MNFLGTRSLRPFLLVLFHGYYRAAEFKRHPCVRFISTEMGKWLDSRNIVPWTPAMPIRLSKGLYLDMVSLTDNCIPCPQYCPLRLPFTVNNRNHCVGFSSTRIAISPEGFTIPFLKGSLSNAKSYRTLLNPVSTSSNLSMLLSKLTNAKDEFKLL